MQYIQIISGIAKRKGRPPYQGGLAVLLLVIMLLPALQYCRKKEPPPIEDYPHFLEVSTDLICERMLFCYQKIYRTLSPQLQRRISPKSCRRAALKDLKAKLAYHTPLMKILSAQCYRAVLDAPCGRIAAVAVWEPACLLLRRETENALQKPKR